MQFCAKRSKLFFALSRTPHGLLDMATPAFSALLWLGAFPPPYIILLGLVTTFAGYTSVYALNDVIDFKSDREKVDKGYLNGPGGDLDALLVRHPMAQGLLSFSEGLMWSVAWGFLAVIGAYLLNPVCLIIFLTGCLLEIIYCLMWRVSPFRTIISGGVKTTGAVAAVFAIDPNPSPLFVTVLFICLFLWEVGGQNVPNDWSDIEEDRRFGAKTVPVRFGIELSARIIFVSLTATVILSGLLVYFSQARFELWFLLSVLSTGSIFLLFPCLQLFKNKNPAAAMTLFNQASYY
ncbi:MAG: UbiA family prenyltransferase, partial [Desulfobacterales bacterium]